MKIITIEEEKHYIDCCRAVIWGFYERIATEEMAGRRETRTLSRLREKTHARDCCKAPVEQVQAGTPQRTEESIRHGLGASYRAAYRVCCWRLCRVVCRTTRRGSEC